MNLELVIVTGTSGLGRKAPLALLGSEEYHVIGAVRDINKMEAVTEIDGFDLKHFTPMECEMNSFESVRDFCTAVDELMPGCTNRRWTTPSGPRIITNKRCKSFF